MVEKKKFFEIEIPLINQKINVLSVTEDAAVGRIIKLDLTKILKGKNAEGAIVIERREGKLLGRFIYINVLPSFIRRMIRKNTSYVEDSFKCKNGNLIIKPYMLTRKKVHRSVRKALRNEAKKFLYDYAEKTDSSSIFSDVLSGKIQKALSSHLKKIYPLSFCEIRVIKEVQSK